MWVILFVGVPGRGTRRADVPAAGDELNRHVAVFGVGLLDQVLVDRRHLGNAQDAHIRCTDTVGLEAGDELLADEGRTAADSTAHRRPTAPSSRRVGSSPKWVGNHDPVIEVHRPPPGWGRTRAGTFSLLIASLLGASLDVDPASRSASPRPRGELGSLTPECGPPCSAPRFGITGQVVQDRGRWLLRHARFRSHRSRSGGSGRAALRTRSWLRAGRARLRGTGGFRSRNTTGRSITRWMSKSSGFSYRRSSWFADPICNSTRDPEGIVVPCSSTSRVDHRAFNGAGLSPAQHLLHRPGNQARGRSPTRPVDRDTNHSATVPEPMSFMTVS